MLELKRLFFSFMQKLLEARNNICISHGTVLMFHQVNNNKEKWNTDNCSITSDSFHCFIESMIEKGISFKSVVDINISSKKNDYYLTFDDAYNDVYTNVAPFLFEKRIPFSVFMTTDFIGKNSYLSLEMLQELSDSHLCTIGSHMVTHSMISGLDYNVISNELYKSKYMLSDITGKPVNYLAYPYGSLYACSLKNQEQIASEVGYKLAFSTINSNLTNSSILNKFFLPRRNVNEKNYLNYLREV